MLVIVKYYCCLKYIEATGDSLFDYDCPWLFQLTVTGNRKQYPQFHRLITADNITAAQLVLSCLALENSCSMFISCWVYESRPWRQPKFIASEEVVGLPRSHTHYECRPVEKVLVNVCWTSMLFSTERKHSVWNPLNTKLWLRRIK